MHHTRCLKFHGFAIALALNLFLPCLNSEAQTVPNFGPNVFVYNPSMPMATIQSNLNYLFGLQSNVNASQFDANRYAILFQPGTYNLAINMGYYMQVLGLGQSPDNVTINGELQSYNFGGQSTENFWMSAENLAVVPTNNSTMTWSVSQGTWLRRMHVEGSLNLSDGTYASGGFLADSKVDSTVSSISQQQWLSRNDIWGNWSGAVWNMVFVGVSNPPSGTWPGTPYTVITNTPLVREKPYLYVDSNTNFFVMVPSLETNSLGTTWANGPTPGVSVPISQFYLAQPGVDNAASINAALNSGMNLILTPGIYHLTNSILVTQPDTIVMGLGYPTLIPTNRNPAMVISDVDGVKVSGIIFDAGTTASPSLLEVGTGCQFRGSFGRPHLSVRHLQPGGRAVCRDNHELRDDQCQQCHRGQSLAVAGGSWRRLNPLLDRKSEPERFGGEWQQRHHLRPFRGASSAVSDRVERQLGTGLFLPVRIAV